MPLRVAVLVGCSALLAVGGVLAAPGAPGLPRVERAAPRATVEQQIGWAHVTIEYGRPEARGRTVFGEMVPFDRLWRLGADEATRLVTDADLALGALAVPAGSYALFAVPHAHSWTLVVNKIADQWGAWNRNPAQDLGRVELDVEPTDAPVEALTFGFESTGERAAVLSIAWERTRAMLSVSVVGDPPVPPVGASGATGATGAAGASGRRRRSSEAPPPPAGKVR